MKKTALVQARQVTSRDEVPRSPRTIRDGVVDDGPHRWRFRGDALVTYLEYQAEEDRAPQFAPWKRLWTA